MDRKDIYNIVIAKKLSGGGGGGDVPSDLRNEMNSVFNEKFQTSIDYPPEEWAATVELMEPYPTESASGAVANFSTPLTLPLVSHNVTIEPVQSGTGDPSPSNPRAISGWSAVTVSHSGADTTSPTTYTRTFLDSNDDPVTVYGGSENLKTGEGTATHAVVDLGTLEWRRFTADKGNVFTGMIATGAPYGNMYDTGTLCEKYKEDKNVQNAYYINDKTFKYGGTYFGARYITILDSSYENATASEFKTAMSGTHFYYPLETPQTFHTDPLNLDTREGVNNICADTGDTAIKFKLTHQDWVDQHTSPEPNLLTKSAPEEVEEVKEEEDNR